LGEPTAQPDGSDYRASRSSIRLTHENGGRYAPHVLADSRTSRSKPRAGIAGMCATSSPRTRSPSAEFAAAALRRVFRWRTAAFRAASAVMFVSRDPDRGQLHGHILHPKGRVTWISSGIVAKKRATRSSVLELRFGMQSSPNLSNQLRQSPWRVFASRAIDLLDSGLVAVGMPCVRQSAG